MDGSDEECHSGPRPCATDFSIAAIMARHGRKSATQPPPQTDALLPLGKPSRTQWQNTRHKQQLVEPLALSLKREPKPIQPLPVNLLFLYIKLNLYIAHLLQHRHNSKAVIFQKDQFKLLTSNNLLHFFKNCFFYIVSV